MTSRHRKAAAHQGLVAVLVLAVHLAGVSLAAASETGATGRGFCRANGGIVTETGNPDVYTCCYPRAGKCVICDAARRQSLRVSVLYAVFRHKDGDRGEGPRARAR